MKQLIFITCLMMFSCLSAMELSCDTEEMETDEHKEENLLDQRIQRRWIQRLTKHREAINLQVPLGTNLAAALKLHELLFFAPEAKASPQYFEPFQHLYYTRPEINHAGTHAAILLKNYVCFVDLRTEQLEKTVISLDDKKILKITKIVWSCDDHYIAMYSISDGLTIYDTSTGSVINLSINIPKSNFLCWHAKNPCYLVVFNHDSMSLEIIDITRDLVVQRIPCRGIEIDKFCFFTKDTVTCSPDGAYVVVNHEYTTTLIDLCKESVFVSDNRKERIGRLEWSPCGRYFVGVSCDFDFKSVVIWDVHENKKIMDCAEWIIGDLESITWAADGRYLIAIVDEKFTACDHRYMRMLIDPWSENKIIASEDMQNSSNQQKNIYKVSAGSLRLSHNGRFLTAVYGDYVVIYDYINYQRLNEYLRSTVTLRQAMVLMGIVKAKDKKEKLLLDSPDIKAAFAELPNYLQHGLKKWVQEPSSYTCMLM